MFCLPTLHGVTCVQASAEQAQAACSAPRAKVLRDLPGRTASASAQQEDASVAMARMRLQQQLNANMCSTIAGMGDSIKVAAGGWEYR